jgi:hypothetical protein
LKVHALEPFYEEEKTIAIPVKMRSGGVVSKTRAPRIYGTFEVLS